MIYVVVIVLLLSTRGTAGADIWCRSWSIGQWSEATSVGLCLKASKAESRLKSQRYCCAAGIAMVNRHVNSLTHSLHALVVCAGMDRFKGNALG